MIGFLYGQTEYNLLENSIHLDDYINRAILNDYKILSITDKNMYGHYKFYQKCKQNNIKPIIGLSIKINSFTARDNYLLAYAQNKVGYSNLVNIATQLEIEEIISDDFLKTHSDGLIFVTSAMDSDFEYYIFEQKYSLAYDELVRLKGLCKKLYVGIMPSSFIFETISQDELSFINKNKLDYLPLSKCCYLDKEDEKVYNALIKISDLKKIMGLDDFHFKSKEELEREFSSLPDIFDNLAEFVELIEDNIIENKYILPKYPNPYNLTSDDYLKGLCLKGLEKRLSKCSGYDYEIYKNRLDYELSVIKKMGYDDYFLIVWDYVKFAKNNGILVGPGRGSAAGSLVSYCLGITEIDPIKYDLMFERFLNPERISMPDIDMDFPDDRRDEVISYVKDKYGKDHVCYITTFGTFQLKSSIRDLFKVFGYDNKYIDMMIKFLSHNPIEQEINNYYSNHPELIELIMIAKKLEDLPRHISTHAAGIILSSESLMNFIPLRVGPNGMFQSQLEAVDLEKLGLLKMDFLGIRNLSILSDMVEEIKKTNPKFDLRAIPLDNKKTFDLFKKADTLGIFQFESAGITNVLRRMKASTFEDIVAILALYRPGPMENIDAYIEYKFGKKVLYLHDDLIPILKDTYGIIIYQEQIMKIAQKFAGYTLAQADVLRKAISKKQKEILETERIRFVSSSVQNGYQEQIANQIYDYIVKFADYGFNRSHSVSYAILSYQMQYIKANYLDIFLSKLLNNVIGNDNDMLTYIKYCYSKNIVIFPPDVNTSGSKFTVTKSGLVMPLNAIHNIGSIATKKIIEERNLNGKYLSFFNFKERLRKEINERMIESLINSGAFDCFNETHAYMLNNIDSKFESYISVDESINDINELSFKELQDNEYESLGFNLKYDVFKDYDRYVSTYKASMPNELTVGKTVNVVALISRVKTTETKKRELMAFVELNCNHQVLDTVIFSDEYAQYHDVFDAKGLVLLNGVVRERNGNIQLQIIKAKKL